MQKEYIKFVLKEFEPLLKLKKIKLIDLAYKYGIDYTFIKVVRHEMYNLGELVYVKRNKKQRSERIEQVKEAILEGYKQGEKWGMLSLIAKKFEISRERVCKIRDMLIGEGKIEEKIKLKF